MKSGAFGLFGKLPCRADFVRISAPGEPFSSFDEWLVSSIEWAHARAGDGWAMAFASGALYAFVFRPAASTSGPILVGAIKPSADRAGRQFPLAVARPLVPSDEELRVPEALPIVLEATWQAATGFLALDHGMLQTGIENQLEALDAPVTSFDTALTPYRAWLDDLPASELWTLLYGPDYGEQPLRALRMIVEAIRPHRAIERPRTSLSLRLPLGQAAGAAVCFWLDLTKRLARWKETMPSFFWSHNGSAGQMLLHLGTPPQSTCAELWQPARDRDEVCDLVASINAEQVAPLQPLPGPFASSVLSNEPIVELLRHAESA